MKPNKITPQQKAQCYVSYLKGAAAQAKKDYLQKKLSSMKRGEYDKGEYKRIKKELIEEMNRCTEELDIALDEVREQNHRVVSCLLMAFTAMDLVTEVMDHCADTFRDCTVGGMQEQLKRFSDDCRHVADLANSVVTGIDEAGNETLSLAYSDMAEDITTELKEIIFDRIERYADTPQGRKFFWGRETL